MGDYVPIFARIQKWHLNDLITLTDLFQSASSWPICLCELQHSVAFFPLWNVSGLGEFHIQMVYQIHLFQFKYQKALFCQATAG